MSFGGTGQRRDHCELPCPHLDDLVDRCLRFIGPLGCLEISDVGRHGSFVLLVRGLIDQLQFSPQNVGLNSVTLDLLDVLVDGLVIRNRAGEWFNDLEVLLAIVSSFAVVEGAALVVDDSSISTAVVDVALDSSAESADDPPHAAVGRSRGQP